MAKQYYRVPNGEESIKQYLVKYGPLYIGFQPSNGFMGLKNGGIMSDCSLGQGGHAGEFFKI
jgi:hypothetical protein